MNENRYVNEFAPLDPSGLAVTEYVSRLPMGVNVKTGEAFMLDLRGRSFIVGGSMGTGKTELVRTLATHVRSHPHGRWSMLSCDYRGRVTASSWGEPDEGDAAAHLERALDDVRARAARMIAAGVEDAWSGDFLGADEPLILVTVDECAHLPGAMLAELLEEGPRAGFVPVVTTKNAEVLAPEVVHPLNNVTHGVAFRSSEKAFGKFIVPTSGGTARIPDERMHGRAVIVDRKTGRFANVQFPYVPRDDD